MCFLTVFFKDLGKPLFLNLVYKMLDWRNLPYHIVEKILLYVVNGLSDDCSSTIATNVEGEDDEFIDNRSLFLLNKLKIISRQWEDVILTSKRLDAPQELVVLVNRRSIDSLRKLIDTMQVCPDLTDIFISCRIESQQIAEEFWRFLLQAIHCNPHPKRIQLRITVPFNQSLDDTEDSSDEEVHYTVMWTRPGSNVDWSFVKNISSYGAGSVDELMVWVSDPKNKRGPDWTYLTNAVSIRQVTMMRGLDSLPRYNFVWNIEANCLKYGPKYDYFWKNSHAQWLNKFEKLILVSNITSSNVDPLIRDEFSNSSFLGVNHSNAHIVFKFDSKDKNKPIYNFLLARSNFVAALSASCFKTLTLPTNATSSSYTTFDCDEYLLDQWEDYLDLWNVSI